jgi:hypothetical protein
VLKFILRGTGYDPRAPKPPPYGHNFLGGLPPPRQLLRLPGQLVGASADAVDFGVVPQHGEVRLPTPISAPI